MYNLLEYSSNYSDTSDNLSFYSKNEANDFGSNIVNTNILKSFKDKTKLIGSTAAANGTVINATIAVPLRYLSNFWWSNEISLINSKVEWKLKWMKHWVLAIGGHDHDDANSNNIIFTIKDTKL